MTAEHLCQQALFAEGINDGKAVGDGQQVHRQGCDCLQSLFERTRNTRVMNCVSNDECDCRCQYSRCRRYAEAVAECPSEALAVQHRGVKPGRDAVIQKGFSEQLEHRHGQKYKEQQCDYTKDHMQLPVMSFHAALHHRSDRCRAANNA